jgi:hypothetical protein
MTAGGFACNLMGGMFASDSIRKPSQQQQQSPVPESLKQKQLQQQQASDL